MILSSLLSNVWEILVSKLFVIYMKYDLEYGYVKLLEWYLESNYNILELEDCDDIDFLKLGMKFE